MKFLILSIVSVWSVLNWTCKKNGHNTTDVLNDTEKILARRWSLKQTITERSGMPDSSSTGYTQLCFIDFTSDRYHSANSNSAILSNTKMVYDNKECTWWMRGWKASSNQLTLVVPGIDTLITNILFLSSDSLAFKGPGFYQNNSGTWAPTSITYCFR